MDVSQTVETRDVVEVGGVSFDKQKLFSELRMFKHSGTWAANDEDVAQKMEDAGLVKSVAQRDGHDMSVTGYKYKQVNGRCRDLFEELNDPNIRYRVTCGNTTFGPFDDESRAMREKIRRQKRNPDVEWEVTKEQIDQAT